MTLNKRKIRLCLIGIIAGLTAWPFIEIFINTQSSFSNYLLFSIILGVLFGAITGAIFGAAEGITLNLYHRLKYGMTTGACLGIIGGIIGCLTGQAILFLIGENSLSASTFQNFGFPIARATGWVILGCCIGLVEGIRSKSKIKIRAGIQGGILGGLLGGLALEYSRLLIDDMMIARLLGLLLFGGMIGLFYSLAEYRLSAGNPLLL